MASLVHLNGPPAVGKSSIAARLITTRPLAFNLDIDELRVRLGGWESDPESKRVARNLGFGLVAAHLGSGRDVVLPQLLLRTDAVEQFAGIATEAGGEFVEVVLVAPYEDLIERLRESDVRQPHPRNVIEDIEPQLRDSLVLLRQLAADRPSALLIDVGGLSLTEAADRVRGAIGWS